MREMNNGVWGAILTPFSEDGSIHTDALLAHAKALLTNGCDGIAFLGTTGEANSISMAEKKTLFKDLSKSGITAESVLLGTGCCAVADTVDLTLSAIEAGFHNFLVLPPFYYKGVSEEGIFQAYFDTFKQLPDSGINIIIYDIPQMSGVTITDEMMLRLKDAFPGSVAGVKNSAGNLDAILKTCGSIPDFKVFAGTEKFLLPTLRAGGAGCISATVNVTSRQVGKIYQNRDNVSADEYQKTATYTREALEKLPVVPTLKEMVKRDSGDAFWNNLRPPMINLSEAQIFDLDEMLEDTLLTINRTPMTSR